MNNLDRAMAYAKQRGVEIPNREELMKLKVDELKTRILRDHDIPWNSKAKKPELVDSLTIATIIHSGKLTPAQIKRIRHKAHTTNTLRDRKVNKAVAKLRRRRFFGLA